MSSPSTLRDLGTAQAALGTAETALGGRLLGRESDVVPAGSARRSVAEALVEALVDLGVEYAFGIFGGGIGPFCRALHESPIRLLHYRHEAGAAFAAIEASLASERLVVVAVTTGPGLTNLYTGMAAARWEGARVLFVSGYTSAERRGRFAFQETSPAAPGLLGAFQAGSLFHHAAVIEHPEELAVALAQVRRALAQPGGFVGHLGIALPQQTAPAPDALRTPELEIEAPRVSVAGSARVAELLAREPFVIWAGFGARHAGRELRALAEAAGAPVMCSPRAKGCFPEQHPLYLGVTGLGGHSRVLEHFVKTAPERVLVLGTKLGEMTSFWSEAFV
ncbi:MAG TPA: thiamine pyrophosphate-binding protein, partial [Polyangiaceae bacterium]|nr:thiamine pyrophosphate-binding protein [Polyangiaceae bacterium]